MKIFLKLLLVAVIFFPLSATNAQVLQRLKNFLSGSTCESSLDCPQGYSCRSKSGGGSQCIKSVECESSSDCPQGLSCRSTTGGGTQCITNSDQNFPSEKKSNNNFDKNQQTDTVIEPVNASVNENTSSGPIKDEKVIYFDFSSSMVKTEFQSIIEAHAQFLKANNGAKLSIEGHPDKRFASLEYSLSIGQKRADAVRQILLLLGVNIAQIETVSFGREKPAVQGNDETAHAKNNRVVLFYK